MNFQKIASSTVAVLLGGAFVLATGTYTDNGGFQLAGGIFLVVGILLAFNQARGRDESNS